jgi:hypothetical protein
MSALPVLLFLVSVVALPSLSPQSTRSKTRGAPETFNARLTVGSAEGRGDAYVKISVTAYSAAKDIQAMEKALKDGGSAAFVQTLKKAPVVGAFAVGDKSFVIRWAREKPTATGRVITLVTDTPVYFVGGGLPGAKAREGFDVAIVQLMMDSSGVGEGKVAAAAKVKPGGDTGVEIEAYDAEPVTLRSVMRIIAS